MSNLCTAGLGMALGLGGLCLMAASNASSAEEAGRLALKGPVTELAEDLSKLRGTLGLS